MYRHILSLLILAILSVACADESGIDEFADSDSCKIVIPFSIDNSSKTRSGEQVFDETIEHVYLMFFSDLNATPDAVVQVKVEDSEVLSFYLPSELKSGTTYTLVAIANADDYVPSGFENFSEYVKSVSGLSDICLFHSGSIVSSLASVSTTDPTYSQVCGVPMKAMDDTFSFTKTNGEISITKCDKLLFYRLVSRVDVINSANNVIIEGIAMCNWRDSGYIADSATLPGNICGVLTDGGVNTLNSLQFVSPVTDDDGSQNLIGALYCFPSVVENSLKGDENTTALIIKARYNGEDTSCYYRVNLGMKEDSSELKANTKYTVNIKDVSGKGYATPEEAYVATTEPSTEPTIPEGMDFALIPLSTDRVKVDHDARTIEIDAFDPDCFNSFIDFEFEIYINEERQSNQIWVKSELNWPLEGRISKDRSDVYLYCPDSFKENNPEVFFKSTKKNIELSFGKDISVVDKDKIFISVGAMAPDDPAIIRKVSIGEFNNLTEYTLTIKPRTVIIDDVVLFDTDKTPWLILDRNIQHTAYYYNNNVNKNAIIKLLERDVEGKRGQAYNYCGLQYNEKNSSLMKNIQIPFKYKDSNNTPFDEKQHELYNGQIILYGSRGKLSATPDNGNNTRSSWLNNFIYSGDMFRTSPFYEQDNIDYWKFPKQKILELCMDKMKVSKMRMFLVSDVPANSGAGYIPICCYLPYAASTINNALAPGYYISTSASGNKAESIMTIFCNVTEVISMSTTDSGMSRLVRSLTSEELDDYKINYLGYGSTPCKLTPCHPDTYKSTSLGWTLY